MRPADLITAAHRHVARMTAIALALTPFEGLRAYAALRVVLARDLSPAERQGLAWAALATCDPDEAHGIASCVIEASSALGLPFVPFDAEDMTDDAEAWAECASPAERLAYARAILAQLSPEERAELLAAAPALKAGG